MFKNHFIPEDDHSCINVQDVTGDGNCLFRALLESMGKRQDDFEDMRSVIHDELMKHRSFYDFITDEELNEYHLPRLTKSGCDKLISEGKSIWQSIDLLAPFANSYGVVVVLHSQTKLAMGKYTSVGMCGTYIPVRRILSDNVNVESFPVCHISWHSPCIANHFVALRNIKIFSEPLVQHGLSKSTHIDLYNRVHDWWSKTTKYSTCLTQLQLPVHVHVDNFGAPEENRNDWVRA
jgi:uncharacterized Rmd1/YagE family protein